MFIRALIFSMFFVHSFVQADVQGAAPADKKELEDLGFVIHGNYQVQSGPIPDAKSNTTTAYKIEGEDDDSVIRVEGTTIDNTTGDVVFLSEGETKKVKSWFSGNVKDIESKARYSTFNGKIKTAMIEQHASGKGMKWYIYKYDADGTKSLDRVLEITTKRKIAYKCDNDGATLDDCDRTVLLTEKDLDEMIQKRKDIMFKKLTIGDESARMPASVSE